MMLQSISLPFEALLLPLVGRCMHHEHIPTVPCLVELLDGLMNTLWKVHVQRI
jgi:hypothetical protein